MGIRDGKSQIHQTQQDDPNHTPHSLREFAFAVIQTNFPLNP